MTDIEMLEAVYNCISHHSCTTCPQLCGDCPFNDFYDCLDARETWLMEYIRKLKRQEDDLK